MSSQTAREWADERDVYLPQVNEGRIRDRHGNDREVSESDWAAKTGLFVDQQYRLYDGETVAPWDALPAKVRQYQTGRRPPLRRLTYKAADLDEIEALEAAYDARRKREIREAAERRADREREEIERLERRLNARRIDPPRPPASSVPPVRLVVVQNVASPPVDERTDDSPTEPVYRPLCDHCQVRPAEQAGNHWRTICAACRKYKTRHGKLPADRTIQRVRIRAEREAWERLAS